VNLCIEYVDLIELTAYANNSRTHSDAQINEIAKSMQEFGFTNPILIDPDRGIIAGHGRLLAAMQIGLGSAPTITLANLTESQKRAYVIADNQLALNAGWDLDPLRFEIEQN
jgi:ParB-like chromosome segregation protein Spo0J